MGQMTKQECLTALTKEYITDLILEDGGLMDVIADVVKSDNLYRIPENSKVSLECSIANMIFNHLISIKNAEVDWT